MARFSGMKNNMKSVDSRREPTAVWAQKDSEIWMRILIVTVFYWGRHGDT